MARGCCRLKTDSICSEKNSDNKTALHPGPVLPPTSKGYAIDHLDHEVDCQVDPVGVDEAVGQVSPDFFPSVGMQHQRIFRLVVQVDEVENDLEKNRCDEAELPPTVTT